MVEKRKWSKNPEIQAGYFQGLQEEVHQRTGITKPVIYRAIKENDISSSKRLRAVQTALDIINERQLEFELAHEPTPEYLTLDQSKNYTYLDYLKWQFADRVELIMGKVRRMSPAPNLFHQRISSSVYIGFHRYFLDQPCSVFYAPFDVRLPVKGAKEDTTVVQPDLCIICDESKLNKMGCKGAPDLVVEILSPGNTKHEMQTKFHLYEKSGVLEYWIVDPANKCVIIYYLFNDEFLGLKPFTMGMNAESRVFPNLSIPVDDIFYKVE